MVTYGLRRLSGSGRLVGEVFTCVCPPGDNLALHQAVAATPPGTVIVAQCHGTGFGVWGEILTVAAQARGVVGLVIDGCVRDLESIRALGFPLFARGCVPRGPTKERRGAVAIPITCGGALIRPRDFLVADESGIVLVPRVSRSEIVRRARERVAKERELIAELRDGATTVELLGLPPPEAQDVAGIRFPE